MIPRIDLGGFLVPFDYFLSMFKGDPTDMLTGKAIVTLQIGVLGWPVKVLIGQYWGALLCQFKILTVTF